MIRWQYRRWTFWYPPGWGSWTRYDSWWGSWHRDGRWGSVWTSEWGFVWWYRRNEHLGRWRIVWADAVIHSADWRPVWRRRARSGGHRRRIISDPPK